MQKIKVFVVEDQPKILKNQLKLLQRYDELELVGSAMSGEAAIEGIEATVPDVVLCDLGLPDMSGIEVTRQLKQRRPEVEVLIFTIFDEEEKVIEAVKAGASGYLLKGAEADKVVAGIKDVYAGGSVVQPNLARALLRHFQLPEEGPAPEKKPRDEVVALAHPLTAREHEVLQIIAKGLSNNETGEVLGISKATIRTHLEHIYQKLEVSNRVEAVAEGVRQGIIDI